MINPGQLEGSATQPLPTCNTGVEDINESKQNEEYIGHLVAIVESSDDAIISKLLDGTIKTWNKGSEKMFGYTADQAVGKHISLIIPLEYINQEKKILQRICNNEIIDHYETVRLKKSGEQFYVSLTVSPLKDRAGNIIGISKIARDITSRRKSEAELIHTNKELEKTTEALKQSNELFLKLFNYNPAAIVIGNALDGKLINVNDAFLKLFGFSDKQEVIGKSTVELNLVSPEQRTLIHLSQEYEVAEHFEVEAQTKNGVELCVSTSVLRLDIDGTPCVISVIIDITERKKTEEQLKMNINELAFQNDEKEKRAAELIVANKELIFQNTEKEKRAAELIVANKELAFQNEEKEKRAAELIIANKELAFQNEEKEKRAAELIIANKELEFQNEEKEKRAAELIIANKELVFQNEEKEKRAAELIIANKELEFQNKEKEKRAAELIIANKELIFQNDEKEKRAQELIIANKELVFQNAEKEKRAEELNIANKELITKEKQLKEVNKELEAFSYSISHDLRAPLRAISGYSIMLQEDYESKLDAEANRIINVIVDNTNMMSQLIDDLLSFSKMARLEVADDSINMRKMAEKCVTELTQIDKKTKYSITIHPMNECKGDASMLKQVWHNLISNALKYSSKKSHPKIEAGLVNDGKQTIYYVKDNGAGFDMRYSDKLFGVFQRLHRQDEFEGTGLGLALTKRIINKHGGEIWAESVLNEGAAFYFSIPKTI